MMDVTFLSTIDGLQAEAMAADPKRLKNTPSMVYILAEKKGIQWREVG